MKTKISAAMIGMFLAVAIPVARADVKVGVITGATGPGASLGIPYKNTFAILPKTLGGEPVQYIIVDDGTDPGNAVKQARKLVTEENVDLIIGPSSTPTAIAASEVASETKTPQISLSPLGGAAARNPWSFQIPQPMNVCMAVVTENMKTRGIKTVGYIGFADSWGDLVLAGLKTNAAATGVKIVAEERYARNDTSVAGQVLRIVAANPDAVVLGGSGTPAALPQIALRERGYKGPIYHNPAVINKDFIRVGGKSVEGAYAPTGPVMVAEQLPDTNPMKRPSLEFTKAYESAYGEGTRNAFSAYSYDAYLLADQAVREAMKKARPGTPQFRVALRDALEATKELVGTHAVYNMSPTDHSGVDARGCVLVQVDNGGFTLVK